ncbi:MAG: hypothetical protein K1X92_04805 [Bacteroidia bacterium]|nr:hypothetical protein [Bacteroidia bacterium]
MKKYILLGCCLMGFLLGANAQSEQTFKGKIIQKRWSKTLDSYCSGGSDYYVLQAKGSDEIILDLSLIEAKTSLKPFLTARKVWIKGKMETFVKEAGDPMMQQPVTPPSCTMLRVSDISFKSKK